MKLSVPPHNSTENHLLIICATGGSVHMMSHTLTSMKYTVLYTSVIMVTVVTAIGIYRIPFSFRLFYLDYKILGSYALPQTTYMAFPLDWRVLSTGYSAFSRFTLCSAIDLVGKPNTTLLIWEHFGFLPKRER